MTLAECIRVPALNDNYIWMLHNPSSHELAIIDPGEAEPVLKELERRGLTPTEIVNTHHHGDHIGGNSALLERFDIPLTAPASEAARIADITRPVRGGDEVMIAGYRAEVIETPGHTTGHVAFYFDDCFGDHGIAFVGDTLFSLGCGRVFEGSMEEMWNSLAALRALPDKTLIACGHEYSASNARYVESLDWPSAEAEARCAEIHALRAADTPTLPVMLGTEKKANPFLNCDTESLAAVFGLDARDPVEVFTALRKGKDNF
ncbi:hydroxyacylglutathione hydrolase [Alphaproteobacteria bacterium LSUCC0684]